jgi:GNAT superfamily N-acetyltransferase
MAACVVPVLALPLVIKTSLAAAAFVKWRGQGLSRALLDAALAWAEQNDTRSVFLVFSCHNYSSAVFEFEIPKRTRGDMIGISNSPH